MTSATINSFYRDAMSTQLIAADYSNTTACRVSPLVSSVEGNELHQDFLGIWFNSQVVGLQ